MYSQSNNFQPGYQNTPGPPQHAPHFSMNNMQNLNTAFSNQKAHQENAPAPILNKYNFDYAGSQQPHFQEETMMSDQSNLTHHVQYNMHPTLEQRQFPQQPNGHPHQQQFERQPFTEQQNFQQMHPQFVPSPQVVFDQKMKLQNQFQRSHQGTPQASNGDNFFHLPKGANNYYQPPPVQTPQAQFNSGSTRELTQRNNASVVNYNSNSSSQLTANVSGMPSADNKNSISAANLQLIANLLQSQQTGQGNQNNLSLEQLAHLMPFLDGSHQQVEQIETQQKQESIQEAPRPAQATRSASRQNMETPSARTSAQTAAPLQRQYLSPTNRSKGVKLAGLNAKENQVGGLRGSLPSSTKASNGKPQLAKDLAKKEPVVQVQVKRQTLQAPKLAQNSFEEKPLPASTTFDQLLASKLPNGSSRQGSVERKAALAQNTHELLADNKSRSQPPAIQNQQKKAFLKRGSGNSLKYDPRKTQPSISDVQSEKRTAVSNGPEQSKKYKYYAENFQGFQKQLTKNETHERHVSIMAMDPQLFSTIQSQPCARKDEWNSSAALSSKKALQAPTILLQAPAQVQLKKPQSKDNSMTSTGIRSSRTNSITVTKEKSTIRIPKEPLSRRSETGSVRQSKDKIKFTPDNVQPVLQNQGPGTILSGRTQVLASVRRQPSLNSSSVKELMPQGVKPASIAASVVSQVINASASKQSQEEHSVYPCEAPRGEKTPEQLLEVPQPQIDPNSIDEFEMLEQQCCEISAVIIQPVETEEVSHDEESLTCRKIDQPLSAETVKEEPCEESKQMIDINIEEKETEQEDNHESMFEIVAPEKEYCLFDANSDSEGENEDDADIEARIRTAKEEFQRFVKDVNDTKDQIESQTDINIAKLELQKFMATVPVGDDMPSEYMLSQQGSPTATAIRTINLTPPRVQKTDVEQELNDLIDDQQSQLFKLKSENEKVMQLQEDLQFQLEKLTREGEQSEIETQGHIQNLIEQEKDRQSHLVSQLKERELFALNEISQLTAREVNHLQEIAHLKEINDNLSTQLATVEETASVALARLAIPKRDQSLQTDEEVTVTVPLAEVACQAFESFVEESCNLSEQNFTEEQQSEQEYDQEQDHEAQAVCSFGSHPTPDRVTQSKLGLEEQFNLPHHVCLSYESSKGFLEIEYDEAKNMPCDFSEVHEITAIDDSQIEAFAAYEKTESVQNESRSGTEVFSDKDILHMAEKHLEYLDQRLDSGSDNFEQTKEIEFSVCRSSVSGSRNETFNLDDDADDFGMQFPEQYHDVDQSDILNEELRGKDDKVQKFFASGKREIIFPNGVRRLVWPDGYSIIYFANNDIKQVFPDNAKTVYFFAKVGTTQSTFKDGLQAFRFANNQIEKHFPDGSKEIKFPDGTVKCLLASGEEESVFPDGTIQKMEKNGLQVIEYANGQKDYLYPDGMRVREYKNGVVKKIQADGSYETIVTKEQASDSNLSVEQTYSHTEETV